ncbi:Asp23/Gls24 family envelope stress response protein [Chloroflexota bacterium]
MGKEKTILGSIRISPKAVATIAYQAILQSYGVVGLAPKNLAEGLAHTITKEPSRGVSVSIDDDKIDIDIHIIVEYGTRVTSVAESVSRAVRFQVEKSLGLPVHNINVHIQGLRVSNEE